MKRIVILIDGTWNEEGRGDDTNIARLDPKNKGVAALIKPLAADDTTQMAFYHKGVGTDPDFLKHLLGGAIGLGLKRIVLDAYQTVVGNYVPGDEIYIIGFSRGAYAARALAGLIGASGIQRSTDAAGLERRRTPFMRTVRSNASAFSIRSALTAFPRASALRHWVATLRSPRSAFTTRASARISMSACTQLRLTSAAGPLCRRSGRRRRTNRHAAMSSKPGLPVSIAMSAAAMRTPAFRTRR